MPERMTERIKKICPLRLIAGQEYKCLGKSCAWYIVTQEEQTAIDERLTLPERGECVIKRMFYFPGC